MKILFFRETELKELSPAVMERQGLAGTENSVICLAKELATRHTVKVICPLPARTRYDNVDYIPFSSYAEMTIFVSMFNPDVLIVAGNPKILYLMLLIARRTIFWQQNHPLELADRFNIPELFKRDNFSIVAPSPEAAEYYKSFYKISSGIHGIYNGVRPEFFNTHYQPAPGKITYCGSFTRAKGMATVLEAARALPDYLFSLCGSYDMYGFEDTVYKHFCQTLSEGLNNVYFMGSLNARDLAQEMASSEIVLVNPLIDNHETCCVSALEAMAVGAPVLAGMGTIIDPIIRHGGLSCRSIFTWGDTITGLMEDPPCRGSLGKSGRCFAEILRWDLIAKQWETIL